MSRRRRRGISPTLFPFLAVLICTLGTLILLLALVAEKATDAAEQRVVEKGEPAADVPLSGEAVESMIEAERFRVEKLVAFRDSQTADLEARRDRLTHLEEHTRRIEQNLMQISAEIEAAKNQSHDDAPETADLVMLREKLKAERQALEELRADAGDQTPRVVIVPHEGPNGTDRRPIYLECTADGLTLWPEGAKISSAQLHDTTPGANPLDAALRVIRHHTTHTYGDPLPPYPLLVVRPGGIKSYAAARQAMRDWDDQFGYELVPAEVELAFQKPDPVLKPRIELAIDEAVMKQAVRQRIVRGGYGGGGYGGGTLGGRSGASGAGRRRRMPTLSAAELDRRGRQNGFRPHDDGLSDAAAGYASVGGYGSTSAYASDDSRRSGAAAVRALDERLRAAADELGQKSAGDDAVGAAGDQLAGGPPAGGPGDGASERVGDRAPKDGSRDGPEEAAESGGADAGAAGNSVADSHAPSGQPVALAGPGHAAVQPSPRPGSDSAPEMPRGQRKPAETGGEGRAEGGDETSGRGSSDRGRKRSGGRGSDVASAGGVAGGSSPSGTDRAAAQSEPAPSPEQASASSSGSSVAPANQKLVRRKGRDWALPEHIAGAEGNAVVRTIRVQCYGDRFVLLPARGDRTARQFAFSDGDVERVTLQLATAVRDRISDWGAAIPGGRWQPRLEVDVMPRGGEARFQQLRKWISGSGLEIQRRSR